MGKKNIQCVFLHYPSCCSNLLCAPPNWRSLCNKGIKNNPTDGLNSSSSANIGIVRPQSSAEGFHKIWLQEQIELWTSYLIFTYLMEENTETEWRIPAAQKQMVQSEWQVSMDLLSWGSSRKKSEFSDSEIAKLMAPISGSAVADKA